MRTRRVCCPELKASLRTTIRQGTLGDSKMANRTRRVPPPPPPPPPVAAPRERALPVARPRRLDITNIGSRTEPRRRPAWTLDTDWPPVDFDSTEQESAPKQ